MTILVFALHLPESFTGTELEYAVDVCHAVMDVIQPTPAEIR